MAKKKKNTSSVKQSGNYVVVVYKDYSLVSYCHSSEIDVESNDLELVSTHDTEAEAKESQKEYATENELKHQY